MPKHISFPDIGQFRNVIRNVTSKTQYVGKDANGDPIYDLLKPLPVLTFEGTVKLHGTNAAICSNGTEIWYQSRERILSQESDNAGFVLRMKPQEETIKKLLSSLCKACSWSDDITPTSNICIYGEWCGAGIQKGVAISQATKMFVVFAIRIDDEWLDSEMVSFTKAPEIGIYNIYDYPTWKIDIDFKYPELAQNRLGELTLAVEQECPVGKAFGYSGVGEGIVWKCITPGYEDSGYWMKVKGEKHSVSKVKTLAPVNVEQLNNQKEFVESTVTEARCLQSITKLKEAGKPTDRTSLGEFIRWIYNDIVKEESDTALANNIDLSKAGGSIANASKAWFFKNENSF